MERRAGSEVRAMLLPVERPEEERMVREECWQEIHRLAGIEHLTVSEIGRRLDLDRKTVRRALQQKAWEPYRRPARTDTLLAEHEEFLRQRAPQVSYSAQILFQELRQTRNYRGSYETVKRFVQPLRDLQLAVEGTQMRFETAPGQQSQIDWGEARVAFRRQAVELHIFVLTLGFSRRSFYEPYLGESLPQFLDAHERAFDYFGGHTREHLYDRPRTVCRPGEQRKVVWNSTFRSFADYWGFEPRLCRAYRAQTKGKVESGVKYFRRNFLPGRSFVDLADFREQLAQWRAEVADVRIHGTTHERPIDRFRREQPQLVPLHGQPSFRLEARQPRMVAEDYLVSLDTNRYSVPCQLIGQTVEVLRRQGRVWFYHRGLLVADHPELSGKHQALIDPAHGPGALARNRRARFSTMRESAATGPYPDVQVRDLAVYEALGTTGGAS